MTIAAPVVRTFLEGGLLQVEPSAIESSLAALWQPAAEAAEQGEIPAVTRVSLGTEVVITSADRAEEAGRVWNSVSTQHPSRAVLVEIDPAHDAGLQAAIAAACHLAAPGQPQVCSERILLRTGPSGLDRLPGAVLPLLQADVPATLWWDLPTPPPATVAWALGRAMDRCLSDLTLAADPAQCYTTLRDCGCEPLSDLAWFRAARWREGLARLFDGGTGRDVTAAIERLEVVGAGRLPGQMFPAALLAGWLAGQLGWPPTQRAPVSQVREDDTELVSRTTWCRPTGAGEILLSAAPVGDRRPGRLQQVTLVAPTQAARWSLERLQAQPRELLVAAHHADWCQLPTHLPAPAPERAEVLLHALAAPPRSVVRDRALRHAAWILGWVNAE